MEKISRLNWHGRYKVKCMFPQGRRNRIMFFIVSCLKIIIFFPPPASPGRYFQGVINPPHLSIIEVYFPLARGLEILLPHLCLNRITKIHTNATISCPLLRGKNIGPISGFVTGNLLLSPADKINTTPIPDAITSIRESENFLYPTCDWQKKANGGKKAKIASNRFIYAYKKTVVSLYSKFI